MTTRRALPALLREPLVHFLLAGGALFAWSAWRGEAPDPASRTIVIDEAQVRQLAAIWQRTWQRPPSPAELDGLIRDHVREEVYYREARRLGLDEDDTIIRRRLRAKMEAIAAAQAEAAAADDATLQAWLDRHPARFAGAATYSFDQIYLGSAAAPDALPAMLARLDRGVAPAALGKPISLPGTLDGAARTEVARLFGDAFAASLDGLDRGRWQGPVASGFGQHLVRVRAVMPGGTPPLAAVRQTVENDWRTATRRAREARAYQALLDGYTVRIAQP